MSCLYLFLVSSCLRVNSRIPSSCVHLYSPFILLLNRACLNFIAFGLRLPIVSFFNTFRLPYLFSFVLRDALDSLSVLPERNPNDFAQSQTATGTEPRLIIDGTERRRQRPKSPEKQALHYSGKKKAHTDKNVVIVDLRRKCIGFLSRTYVGKTHDKKIADSEGISYPPKAELYKDTGFQGYEPAVTRTCQAKKKAAPRGTHSR